MHSRVVPVLVVDGDVKDGVDVADGQLQPPVPHRGDRLVLGVRLQPEGRDSLIFLAGNLKEGQAHSPLVVELEDDEGVALAADVGRHEVLGAVHLRRQVAHVAKVARQAVQPLRGGNERSKVPREVA